MKTASAKAKGRRLCQKVKETLLSWAPDLSGDDIVVTSSGDTGEDLKLSPAARAVYPLAIECKNQESINIWAALEQARGHQREDAFPAVCFTRNREARVYVAMDLEHFLRLVR